MCDSRLSGQAKDKVMGGGKIHHGLLASFKFILAVQDMVDFKSMMFMYN